jgi:uncharacterized protein (DUF1697 family)
VTGKLLVALLRAVNVGGTGPLPMQDLVRICEGAEFTDVRTYIQSGNVVFRTRLTPDKAGVVLGRALLDQTGAAIDVLVRTPGDLDRIVRDNPFLGAEGAKVVVLFSSEKVPKAALKGLSGPAGEEVVPDEREIYIHYPEGQGRSKLKLPRLPGVQTARNINTVTKLAEMCRP